jgi:hypothetical protein
MLLYNTVNIFPLQVKNKSQKEVLTRAFILGPVSLVANKKLYVHIKCFAKLCNKVSKTLLD